VTGRESWIALAIILAAALVLRAAGLAYGLPYVFYPDEAVIVNHAVAFGTGDLNPHFFNYPSLYMYCLFVMYGISYVIGAAAGVFHSTDEFARLFFIDSTLFYLSGRVVALACGVGNVLLLYALGKRIYNEKVGLMSAALLSFSPHHIAFSHVIKIEVPAGFLATASLWFTWSAYKSGALRSYALAGLLAGLAASTMYPAGFVIIALPIAQLLRYRAGLSKIVDRNMLAAAPVCALGFFIGTPFAILDWRAFLSELSSVGNLYSSGRIWVESPFFPFTSLLESMGSTIGAVALLGTVYAVLVRRGPGDLIVASYPVFLGFFFAMFATKEYHHMIIGFPALCLLGGRLLDDAVQAIARQRRWAPVAMTAATVAIVAVPADETAVRQYRLTLPDTRMLAKEWIETHVPYGSTIVMDGGKYYLESHNAPIPVSAETIRASLDRIEHRPGAPLDSRIGTRRLGYAGEAEYFRQMLKAVGERPGYDVVRITHDAGSDDADVRTLDEYVEHGASYAVVSSVGWEHYRPGGEEAVRHPEKAARYTSLYASLQEHATLLKEFAPSGTVAGPTLRIYRLPSPAGGSLVRADGELR
jgi:hypothetical protein